MVIATTNNSGNPEAAFVGFAQKSDLSLIFGTKTFTRKYKNILKNSNIALVFGEDRKTIQYEGTVEDLQSDELEECKKIYFGKNPSAKKYENQEGQIYLKINPKWIRYTDYSRDTPEIFEISF